MSYEEWQKAEREKNQRSSAQRSSDGVLEFSLDVFGLPTSSAAQITTARLTTNAPQIDKALSVRFSRYDSQGAHYTLKGSEESVKALVGKVISSGRYQLQPL